MGNGPTSRLQQQRDAWRAANRQHELDVNAQWRAANRERHRAMIRSWKEQNKGRLAESVRFRQAKKRHATPPWLTPEHRAIMQEIYTLAASVGWHVDHVTPLVHPLVCGLHVPWNLQVLPPVENMRKSNKLL